MYRAIVVACVLALSSTALAQQSPAVDAATQWWDEALNSDALPTPTKKKPLHYGVFPYAAEPCGVFDKKRVDKITSRKAWTALTACLSAAHGAEENPEYTWEASDVDTLLIGFDQDKKAVKKIRKAAKKMDVVSLEIRGKEDAAAVHVLFLVDKKGAVRGVYMYVDAAG
jgi:hypothetical protein